MITKGEKFTRGHRLTAQADFKRVYQMGKRLYSPFFILYLVPNRLFHHRLGVVVSKKVGNAVLRNKTKRVVREAFRQCPCQREHGLDMVVVSSPNLVSLNSWQIAELLKEKLSSYYRSERG